MNRPLRLLFQVWGALSIYLPLFIMGGLGLGTYWLYRNTPEAVAPVEKKPAAHEADYFMREFAVRSLDTLGTLKSEVRGQRLLHFEDTQTLEIEKVEIFSYNPSRQRTTATADRAISNADGSEVQLIGNARVMREGDTTAGPAPLSFQGEFLHLFVHTERVRSHKPVLMVRGNDRIQAASLDFSYLDRTATFNGQVQATFAGRSKSVR